MDVDTWRAMWGHVHGGWLAGDGFAGIAHPIDGRYLFLHGDTFWQDESATWATRNSATIWDPARPEEIRAIYPTKTDFIPDAYDPDGSDVWYWHGDMTWDGPDLWVMPLRARAVSGGWGFENHPPRDLVQLSWPLYRDPSFVARYPLPFGTGTVEWGASLLRAPASPFIYVYGVTTQPGWYGYDVYCARAPSGKLLEAASWRFFTGAGQWSASELAAVPIIGHGAGTNGTFSTDVTVTGKYRIVSKMPGDFGSAVTMWESRSPTGPWKVKTLLSIPWTSADQTYGAFAHPGLVCLDNGQRLVSVNHNTDAGLSAILASPGTYRPSWHEITW